MATVTLQQLCKRYNNQDTLHSLNLDIRDGEFLVLVGPSGCGKSTLLRMIAGLESVTSGEISIGDRKVNTVAPADRKVSMVFQSYALYPHMTVWDNMAFGLKMARVSQDEQQQRITKVSEILQLEPYLERKPAALSGGQRQRVAIGRAIVRQPEVFLFDEPLSNLDAKLRDQMRVQLNELHKRLGSTMIYVTHDQKEAMTMADRIVVMREGRIEQVGTPQELYYQPANRFVAEFIGSPAMNFLPVSVTEASLHDVTVRLPWGQELKVPCNGLGIREDDKLELGVRPHAIALDRSSSHVLKIDVKEQLGHMVHLHGHVGDIPLIVEADSQNDLTNDIGIALDSSSCHLFDTEGNSLYSRLETADAA